MIHELTTDTIDVFVKNNKVAVIDFWAEWCQPCQRMMKILPRLDEEVSSFAAIGKIETDSHPEAAFQYEIKKIPTFIFFKNGEEVSRTEGRMLTLAEIQGVLSSLALTE